MLKVGGLKQKHAKALLDPVRLGCLSEPRSSGVTGLNRLERGYAVKAPPSVFFCVGCIGLRGFAQVTMPPPEHP